MTTLNFLKKFSFPRSGLSEGSYVTYGFYEKDDIKCVVDNLLDMPHIVWYAHIDVNKL